MIDSKAITLTRESPNEKDYRVSQETSLAEIREFVKSLREEFELAFHDQFYPSVTDPGAYVSVQRNEDLCAYRFGNHGWSSGWTIQSIELISAHIFVNAKSQRNDELPFVLTIRKIANKFFSAKDQARK